MVLQKSKGVVRGGTNQGQETVECGADFPGSLGWHREHGAHRKMPNGGWENRGQGFGMYLVEIFGRA